MLIFQLLEVVGEDLKEQCPVKLGKKLPRGIVGVRAPAHICRNNQVKKTFAVYKTLYHPLSHSILIGLEIIVFILQITKH